MKLSKKLRILAVISALSAFLTTGCLDELLGKDGLGGILNDSLTTEEVVKGLKEALKIGVDNATDSVSETNGYLSRAAIKILLPDSVNAALGYVQEFTNFVDGYTADPVTKFGFDLLMNAFDFDYKSFLDMEGALVNALNKAAEVAAKDTAIVPIFWDAITGMTFTEAWNILDNEDSVAATAYFKGKTLNPLVSAYSPYLTNALESVGANKIWTEFSTAYATFVKLYNDNLAGFSSFGFSFSEPLTPLPIDLGPYATGKAVDGLFYMVGKEETKIRNDPLARVTEILQKVFKTLDE